MPDYEKLSEKLGRIKNEEGMVGGRVKLLPLTDAYPNVTGAIDPRNWEAEIRVNTNWHPEKDKALAEWAKEKGITDIVESSLVGATRHEVGHWKTCPYDIFKHEHILDVVTKTLQKSRKEGSAAYIANAFEDLVDNAARAASGDYDGCTVLYYDQGRNITPFYKEFVRLNVLTWGGKRERELFRQLYGENADAWEGTGRGIVRKIMSDMGLGEDLKKNAEILSQPENWEKFAEAFTSSFASTISDEDKAPEDNEPQDGQGQGQNQQGQGQGSGQQKKDKGEGSGQDDDDNKSDKKDGEGDGEGDQQGQNQQGGSGNEQSKKRRKGRPTGFGKNPFDDKLKDPEELKKIVRARLEAGGNKAGRAQQPSWMDPLLFMDLLYESASPEIVIKAQADRKGQSLPLVPYGREPYDPESHSIRQVRFNRLLPSIGGRIGGILDFAAFRHYEPIELPFTDSLMKGFPDICFIIDTSGSMQEGGTDKMFGWGDGSKYHYALLGIYGVIKCLRARAIAPYIQYNSINFSNETRASGWKPYDMLFEVKKNFLSPQMGGTEIRMDTIRKELLNRPKKAVIIMLSDGEIGNWGSISGDFIGVIRQHMPVFIQTCGTNQTTQDMQRAGIPVFKVSADNDLATLMIDLTIRSYAEQFGGTSIQLIHH